MSDFSYDLSTDIGQLRLELGDTAPSDGVRPDGSNFTDSELQHFLSREGNINLALAAACEVLSRMWSVVSSLSVGSRREALSDVAKAWSERARELREKYGGGMVPSVAGVIRVDGFSDDVASDDVEAASSEFSGDFRYVRPA
jgi:hypothetical protein